MWIVCGLYIRGGRWGGRRGRVEGREITPQPCRSCCKTGRGGWEGPWSLVFSRQRAPAQRGLPVTSGTPSPSLSASKMFACKGATAAGGQGRSALRQPRQQAGCTSSRSFAPERVPPAGPPSAARRQSRSPPCAAGSSLKHAVAVQPPLPPPRRRQSRPPPRAGRRAWSGPPWTLCRQPSLSRARRKRSCCWDWPCSMGKLDSRLAGAAAREATVQAGVAPRQRRGVWVQRLRHSGGQGLAAPGSPVTIVNALRRLRAHQLPLGVVHLDPAPRPASQSAGVGRLLAKQEQAAAGLTRNTVQFRAGCWCRKRGRQRMKRDQAGSGGRQADTAWQRGAGLKETRDRGVGSAHQACVFSAGLTTPNSQ